jgi:stage V sporulation protein B
MLSFAYGAADAARGASVLRVMALAQAAFAMLGIATTVLTSIGRERLAAAITFAAVIAVGVACTVAVPHASFGQAQLMRSAEASGGALLVTLLVASAVVRRDAGAFVPVATVARVGLALGTCVAAGFFMPRFGRLLTPVVALGVALLYLGLLVATRELGAADIAMVRSVRRRS